MLIIAEKDLPYFTKVCDFAERTKQSEKLWQQLWYLHLYCDKEIPEVRPYRCGACWFHWTRGLVAAVTVECPRCNGMNVAGLDPRSSFRGETNGTGRCRLFYDSAPASFTFSLDGLREGGRWEQMFFGGLIYHGNQAGWEMSDGRIIPEGYGVETFNVQIGFDRDSNPWTINT